MTLAVVLVIGLYFGLRSTTLLRDPPLNVIKVEGAKCYSRDARTLSCVKD